MNQKIEEKGLPQIGNAYFMWRSTTGKTHAINPENKKTFCGLTVKQSWEPTDELPDKTHEPSCPKCKDHYLDPLRKDIEGIITELKECINEFLTVQLWTLNANGGLGRFTEAIAKFTREENKLAIEEAKKKGIDVNEKK
jgi:hypothetical protein